ncbi:MAG: HD domain-containing protein [Armatimonadetes bacterium]|nr:HD domain-containing protein [Armatimonadota bacterium]
MALSTENEAPSRQPSSAEDPVLSHLLQAGKQYQHLLDEKARQEEELHETRSGLEAVQAQLGTVQSQSRNLQEDLNTVRKELEKSEEAQEGLQAELQRAQARLDQERRNGQDHRDRAEHLAREIRQIHRSLLGPDGNIYLLLLHACLNLTGAKRGLYVTARGDGPPFRIRAAIEVDGYPDAPPSEFIQALCRKALKEDETFVCNDGGDLAGLPSPERDGERFESLIVAPVVLLQNLDGVVVVADKENGEFGKEDEEVLVSIGDHAAIAAENQKLRRDLLDAYLSTITMLADAVEAKDPYTRGHCEQVSRFARHIADRLGMPEPERDIVCYAALLHDVGKIGVSDGVLNKPGPLLPEEFDLVRSHVRTGQTLILNVPALERVADVVLHHHEWFDGSGYPDGLKGEEIPLGSRIICAVDSYCAMITRRSYKEAYSEERARAELQRCSGTQFDPEVVREFMAVLDSPEAFDPDEDDISACGILPGMHVPGFESLSAR